MPITELLTRNATYFKDDVALVEINPEVKNVPHLTWREYSLIESNRSGAFRKQLTWGEFDVKANRFANLLLTRGIKKGDKVAILLMNCLDWLPIYFGILKTGAIAVPLNFRYTAEEIAYCVNKVRRARVRPRIHRQSRGDPSADFARKELLLRRRRVPLVCRQL